MIEEQDGWFVRNVKDATWVESPQFGKRVRFEPAGERWTGLGVGISILEPGKPACRYHRENAQENFLVLSGHCKLLVNDEERELGPWDFVHCPAGVTHVFVGAGEGPCVVLMMGERPEAHKLFYPENERAKGYGAQAPEPTADPRVAYSDVTPAAPCDLDWPLG